MGSIGGLSIQERVALRSNRVQFDPLMRKNMDLNAIRERRARLEALTARMKIPELTPEAVAEGGGMQRRRSFTEISSPKEYYRRSMKSRKPTGGKLQPLKPGEENELDTRGRNDALLMHGGLSQSLDIPERVDRTRSPSPAPSIQSPIQEHNNNIDEGNSDNEDSQENLLVQIPGVVKMIKSDDEKLQLKGTQLARKHLSRESNPPIDPYIEEGIIAPVAKCMKNDKNPTLQFESLWVLTNLTSGNEEHTRSVYDTGCIPDIIKCLKSPNDEVVMQAVWALSNIAGESKFFRDEVISYGALPPLDKASRKYNERDTYNESNLEILAWTYNNLVRYKPIEITVAEMKDFIETCKVFLDHPKPTIHSEALVCFFYITDEPQPFIEEVLNAGALSRIIELLYSTEMNVMSPAVRTIGSILAGSDEQTDEVIESGGLEGLKKLLGESRKNIKKEAAWALSNILAGTLYQIQQTIDAGIVKDLIRLAESPTEPLMVRKESIWGLSNLAKSGTPDQVQEILYMSGLSAFQEIFDLDHDKINEVALLGLISIVEKVDSSRPMIKKKIKVDTIEKFRSCNNATVSNSANRLYVLVYEEVKTSTESGTEPENNKEEEKLNTEEGKAEKNNEEEQNKDEN